jgi:polyhydroxybutyrate depolymerase
VIDFAIENTSVDPSRVYLTGFSNGAGMTFRAGTELASRLAAVAPVAGNCWIQDPKPVRPIPTFFIVGSSDPLIPLNGGSVRNPWQHRLVKRPAVAETLERWAAAIDCNPIPVLESEAQGVRIETYPSHRLHGEFRTAVVEGLGHHWPGGKGQLSQKIAGPIVQTYDATAEIWRFFERHVKKD